MADPEAIGLIETRGFIPLVVAVDAMAKSAHVALLGVERAGDGLVTAVIGGDISSVAHATAVGSAAAANVGEVVGVQIIGRLVGNLRDLLPIGHGHSLSSRRSFEPGLADVPPPVRLAGSDVPRLSAGSSSGTAKSSKRGRGQGRASQFSTHQIRKGATSHRD